MLEQFMTTTKRLKDDISFGHWFPLIDSYLINVVSYLIGLYTIIRYSFYQVEYQRDTHGGYTMETCRLLYSSLMFIKPEYERC